MLAFSPGGFLIALICGAALAAIIFATILNDDRKWRQCLKCGCFFNQYGEQTERAPLIMDYDDNEKPLSGLCEDCTLETEMGKNS